MTSLAKRLGSFFLDIIQTVVLALAIFVISYLFLFQPHQVKGTSMHPNFENNEFLLTDKLSYRLQDPNKGDVVVFKAPPSEPCAVEECEYIKRVVGLPGEKVQIKDESVYVNDQKLDEPYLPSTIKTEPGSLFAGRKIIILEPHEYLLLGDNRQYSRDGREFGPIKRDTIVGRAWLRYWPPSKIGFVQ